MNVGSPTASSSSSSFRPSTMQPAAGGSQIKRLGILARDIKLSHTVFATPFALLGAFLAAAGAGRLPGARMVVLIVVCMVFARTFAMAVNRLADRKLDAFNPRTAGRALASGRLSVGYMACVAVLSAAGLVGMTGLIGWLAGNWWPMVLSPVVLVWLGVYSYTKRFTWLCHLWLGASLAMSPLAAAVAVGPGFLERVDVYLLAVMVACWVAGFDVIYAMQDVAVDRGQGLFSMPARLGVGPALWVSRLLHVSAAAALVVLGVTSPVLGVGFAVGVGLVIGLLVLEHALVWGSKAHHINVAFFTVNGVISVLLGGLGIWDVVSYIK